MELEQVKILSVSRYSFEDEKTKRKVEGCSVWFTESKETHGDDMHGYPPKKVTLPFDAYGKFATLNFPHSAVPILESRFTQKGVKTEVTDFKLVKPVSA